MSADRALGLLALVVARQRRARFLEEWRSDVAAASSVGVAPEAVLLAACRVALVLLRLRIRDAVRRSRRGAELLGAGALLGLLLAVTDVPAAVLLPVVLLVTAARGGLAATSRIRSARLGGVR